MTSKTYSAFAIFLVLGIGAVGCNRDRKKVIAYNKNGTKEVELEYPMSSDTLTYAARIFYPNGKLKKIAHIVNGKFVGSKFTYFANGRVYQIDSLTEPCDRNSDEWNGILVRNYENGKISQRFVVKNGRFEGLFQQYGVRGNLIKQYVLKDDSIKNGLYEEFFDNGRLSARSTYADNLLEGHTILFRDNGDTARYFNFRSGVLILPLKKWLADGRVLVGEYINGSKSGVKWIWFDKSGRLIKSKIVASKSDGDFLVPE